MQNTPSSPKLWRWLRRGLVTAAVLATLVALYYAEEDWRGKRDWEKFKREAELKGEVVDWKAYIPPPVPDDQNIFKAPKMAEWFVGRGATSLSRRFNYAIDGASFKNIAANGGRVLLAELTVAPSNGPAGGADAVLRMGDPNARAEAEKIVQGVIGPTAEGAAGFTFTARALDGIKPVHVVLVSDRTPTAGEIEQLFPHYPVPVSVVNSRATDGLRVEAAGENAFRVWLSPPNYYTAAEYLAWCDQCEPEFSTIREALKRPDARMDGDYEQALGLPLQNFVAVRVAAQVLGQRAQCHLLLGQADRALEDWTLLHDLSRLLEAKPAGKPIVLVSAMIDVAITGLSTTVVADGLQQQAWREPQLAALEGKLAETDLPAITLAGLDCERVHIGTALTANAEDYANYLATLSGGKESFGQKLKDPLYLFLKFAPRGWRYQNMILHDRLYQQMITQYNLTNGVISPRAIAAAMAERQATVRQFHPYYVLNAFSPAFERALQSVARNQTMVNEAQIVCALERYRLANGSYPDTLAGLSPRFITAAPRDIINGESLKYRQTDDGQFVLYSVGWNESDDGGKVVMDKDGKNTDFTRGDWVWPMN